MTGSGTEPATGEIRARPGHQPDGPKVIFADAVTWLRERRVLLFGGGTVGDILSQYGDREPGPRPRRGQCSPC